MFNTLRENLVREPAEVRNRIMLHCGDMRDFRLNRTFPLVTIPFRPMQHMHTLQDQIQALQSARAHLSETGVLAFDVFYPKFEVLHLGMGEERLEAEWSPASDPQTIIKRYFRKDAVDKINQNFTLTFIFRCCRGGKLVLEENDTIKMSYYTYPQLKSLFLLAGLEPIAEYGSFDKAGLDNTSQEMIFLLRRRQP